MVASCVRSQRSIALSSGASEFAALVGGSSEALYIGDCLKLLVENGLEIQIHCRSGHGRIRHLDASLLWVQVAVKTKRLAVGIVSVQLNPADLGSKPLTGPRLRELFF